MGPPNPFQNHLEYANGEHFSAHNVSLGPKMRPVLLNLQP